MQVLQMLYVNILYMKRFKGMQKPEFMDMAVLLVKSLQNYCINYRYLVWYVSFGNDTRT